MLVSSTDAPVLRIVLLRIYYKCTLAKDSRLIGPDRYDMGIITTSIAHQSFKDCKLTLSLLLFRFPVDVLF